MTARLTLPDTAYATPESRRQFADRVLASLAGVPAITEAAVSNTINQATRRVFQKVQELEAYPTEQMTIERGLDLVIIPRLNEATLALNTEIGFWGNDAAGAMHLAVEMAVFTREFMQLTMVRATGNGIGEQGIGLFSSGKSEFSVSVENALRDMGNNAVQQLYGNYDIRQFVEALAAEEDETW